MTPVNGWTTDEPPHQGPPSHGFSHAPQGMEASGPWGVLSQFLNRYGLPAGLLLLVSFLAWSNDQDRRAYRDQMERQLKDLNGQMYHIGSAITSHVQEGNELLQVVRALCVNSATTPERRDRCLEK